MHDDARPLARGDAFILPGHAPVAFGVVEAVRPEHGLVFVRMQNGLVGWAAVSLVEQGRERLEEYAVEGFA